MTLAAVGSEHTSSLPPLEGRQRWLRLAEMALLYLGAPVVMTWLIFGLRLPLFLVLQPVLLGVIALLLIDKTFVVRREIAGGFGWATLGSILLIFAIAGAAITWGASALYPERFLDLPRNRFGLWITILILYPLMSVIAQELVYRTFFFHRYGALFAGNAPLAIATNGLLFGVGHVIFGNWIAIGGTIVVGWLFAWRYHTSRSLWAVCLEHALYGALVFTVGLGSFFFTGVSKVGR